LRFTKTGSENFAWAAIIASVDIEIDRFFVPLIEIKTNCQKLDVTKVHDYGG
jgi:hypothetical protein